MEEFRRFEREGREQRARAVALELSLLAEHERCPLKNLVTSSSKQQ
jgi:hypothetical protein